MSRYKVLKASDIRQYWSEVVNEVACENTRILIEKSGVPVASVVSRQDLEWLEERRLEIGRVAGDNG
ncbi:prevent-host-death family protein [Sulfobacillus thermosulfidooxidans DSM 9293]|uniref:Prevent-host-death family protein n=1 Tax=Sulfobacillus thermosulfidooxidans (strain DSM 9293 / VKM B-1269 / AT-1) TaxID=929705 RepID=A0A1W1WPL8_SULTA|nr:type II toxin-antitoxin system prevent-host-death family antitoxin [Sulfobacillus thermosulfidooxidans]SMC08247.1 prevent-host-death family protein [Sulfobacillus thermosulfidooxidans DSM 9293]